MSERIFEPHPNDKAWVEDFDVRAEKEFSQLESDLGELDDKIEDKFSYGETYRALLLEYADTDNSTQVEFVNRVRKFIEENKASEDTKVRGQVRAHQDILSELMSERG